MLRLTDIKLPLPDGPAHSEAELRAAAAQRLGLRPGDILSLRLARRSLDARKKNAAVFLYSVDVSCADEGRVLAHAGPGVTLAEDRPYRFPVQAPAGGVAAFAVAKRPMERSAQTCPQPVDDLHACHSAR